MRAPLTDLPIVFEDVAVTIRNTPILDGVSLTLAPGPPTILVGPNGAGKTTLLRLAMGLLQPSRGRTTWGGRADASATRRAIVFQRPVMLRRSAAGNARVRCSARNLLNRRRIVATSGDVQVRLP